MTGIIITLLATTFWGLSDFGGSLISKRLPVPFVIAFYEVVGMVALGVVLLLVRPTVPTQEQILVAALAGAAGISGLALFFWAMSRGAMAVVAPIASAGAVIPVIYGIASGDPLTVSIAAGLIMVLVGCVLVSQAHNAEKLSREMHRKSILVAIAAAILFGIYFIGIHDASGGNWIWITFVARAIALPGALAVVLYKRKEISQTLKTANVNILWLVPLGLIDNLATALYALANQHADLSVVAVLGSLYPVVAIILARLVLHEKIKPLQGFGIVLALGGVAFVSAAAVLNKEVGGS